MSRVLVIGCGGVASVAIQKCCQADDVFTNCVLQAGQKKNVMPLPGSWREKQKQLLPQQR